jgi:PAS domain-containing protein
MLGFDENEIGSDPLEWIERIHADDKSRVINELHVSKNAESAHFECEYRIKDAEGNYRWVMCRGLAVFDEDGKAYRMTGSQTDISELKRARGKLASMLAEAS